MVVQSLDQHLIPFSYQPCFTVFQAFAFLAMFDFV